METNVTENLKFPGWAQRLGTGSIANRVREQFNIYPQFWLQSIRRKTVTISLDRYNDKVSEYFWSIRVDPNKVRNFILNNSDQYTDLIINFNRWGHKHTINWYDDQRLTPLNLNGITVRSLTINQNGMKTNRGDSRGGLGAYEAFTNINTNVQTNYN